MIIKGSTLRLSMILLLWITAGKSNLKSIGLELEEFSHQGIKGNFLKISSVVKVPGLIEMQLSNKKI